MNAENQVYLLLEQYGGVLEREGHHNIYRFPDGRTFVTAKTGSDWRGWDNNLHDLQRFLGLTKTETTPEGERHGPAKPGAQAVAWQDFQAGQYIPTITEKLLNRVTEPEVEEVVKEHVHRLTKRGVPKGFSYVCVECEKLLRESDGGILIDVERPRKHGIVKVYSREQITALNRKLLTGQEIDLNNIEVPKESSMDQVKRLLHETEQAIKKLRFEAEQKDKEAENLMQIATVRRAEAEHLEKMLALGNQFTAGIMEAGNVLKRYSGDVTLTAKSPANNDQRKKGRPVGSDYVPVGDFLKKFLEEHADQSFALSYLVNYCRDNGYTTLTTSIFKALTRLVEAKKLQKEGKSFKAV